MVLFRKIIVVVGVSVLLGNISMVCAQFQDSTQQRYYRATVIHANQPVYDDQSVQSKNFIQKITVRTNDNQTIEMDNDFVVLQEGSRIYLQESIVDGESFYTIFSINRSRTLIALACLFVCIVVVFGGKNGARALMSLLVSIGVIFFVLVPVVNAGYSPIIWGILISILLLAITMVVTHGFSAKTWIAFCGTSIAVLITGVIAYFAVSGAQFNGLASDEAFHLSLFNQSIDLASLLLAGIIIGMLGVLDDAAITQVSVVTQLRNSGVQGRQLYQRAMIVGRDHVGALINTLMLAYAGAALPLFLLLMIYNEPLGALLNTEVIAVEIVRAIVGSIGLVLAVPITTLIAVYLRTEFTDDHSGHHVH